MRKLFWGTIGVLSIASGFAYIVASQSLPPKVEVAIDGQPTIGNPDAPVKVVLFEEPKCPHCKRFTEEVFPKLKEKYIDTKQISFTLVPVAFLKGSMPAATALISVYLQNKEQPNSELFFTYLDYMYKNQSEETLDWATPENLQRMAKAASPVINIAKLKRSANDEAFRSLIEKNTEYGKKLMGHLTTPTLYVNGMKADDVSYETVSKLIESAKRKK